MTPQAIALGIHEKLRDEYNLNLDPRLIFAQMWHETGNFSSELAKEHHNYGGITQDTPNGLGQPDGSLYYMNFNSDEDYVDYMAGYYSKYKADGLFEAKNISEYAEALKRGGYFGASIEDYIEGMKSGIMAWEPTGGNGILGVMSSRTDSHGNVLQPVFSETSTNAEDEDDVDFIDKFMFPIREAPLVKSLRTGLVQMTNPVEAGSTYTFTQEDMNLVSNTFNGDVVSQNFIYSNANSHEQLIELVQMQKESKEMERRIAQSSYGMDTVGSLTGNFIAELVFNPLNWVGLGFLNKGALAARVLKCAAFNGALNVADSKVRERMTGMEQDLIASAGVGMAVGAALPFISRLAAKGANETIRSAAQKAEVDLINTKAEADAVLDNMIPTRASVFERFKNFHDVDFKPTNARLQQLVDTGKAIVVPKEKLGVLSRLLKFDLPDNTRAFNVGDTTFFVKEVVSNMSEKTFDNLVLHEIGVHALPKELKEPILSFVRKQIEKPKGLWREALDKATAATPKGETIDPEEVLGYWAELRGDNPKGGFLSELTDKLNKALGRTDLTNDDVLEIIKTNRDDVLFAKEAEGDVVKLSTDADVTQNNIVRLGQDDRPKKGVLGKASRWMETNAVYATTYGKLANSKLKTVRDIGVQLFSDARQRATNVVMSAEDVRAAVINQINIPLKKYANLRRNYAYRRYGTGMFLPKNVEQLDREIMLYHDYLFAGHSLPEGMEILDKEVEQLARYLNDVEAMEIKMAKRYGYLDKEWDTLDKGTRRMFNIEKWQKFLEGYVGNGAEARAKKDLEDYFYTAAYLKRDENKALLQSTYDKEYEKALQAAKRNPTLSPPERRVVEEADLDEFIRSEAAKAANGYIDLNTGNFGMTNGDEAVLPWMRHRLHMDSSYTTVVNGRDFSFDTILRSYDLELMLNRTVNRWAGEIALNYVFDGKGTAVFKTMEGGYKSLDNTLENYRQMIINEGKQRVAAGGCSQSEADEALKVFDIGIRDLRGLPQDGTNTAFSQAVDLLRNYTYARVGGNMSLNQKIDFGNTVGYVGFRALTSMLPFVGRKIQGGLFGANYLEAVSEQTAKLMGDDLRDLNFVRTNLWNSKRGAYFRNGSALDTLNNVVGTMTEVTNSITGLGNLTARMIRDVRMFTYMDVLKAVKSVNVDKAGNFTMMDSYGLCGTRSPFSVKKLAAAGISDKKAFFTELKKYLTEDGLLDLDKMVREDLNLHSQLWKLIDNQSKRAVVEPSIGNKNLLASSSAFFKMLFQFKNFSFYATQSQTFRKLHNRELDDAMATIYETLMAAGVTYVAIQGAAWAKHGTNEQARRDYIDERMENFYYGVATRTGTIGSPLAFFIDLADALGYQESFRTTTSSRRYRKSNDPLNNLFKFIAQSPALETLSLMFQNAHGYTESGITKKNVEDSIKLFVPANNWYPLATLLNSTIESFDLPEK